MRFKGSFYLPDAQFTSAKIQDRVDELSRRGQGKRLAGVIDPAAVGLSAQRFMMNRTYDLSAAKAKALAAAGVKAG